MLMKVEVENVDLLFSGLLSQKNEYYKNISNKALIFSLPVKNR